LSEVDVPVESSVRAIFKAAKSGDIATVRDLLNKDPKLVDARDQDESTPLHCAAWKGQVDVVTTLLDAGADVNAQNKNDHWGTTPLHAAAHGNQRAVAELLLTRGANRGALNSHGRTPLAETAIHRATAVARLLRDSGKNV